MCKQGAARFTLLLPSFPSQPRTRTGAGQMEQAGSVRVEGKAFLKKFFLI